MAKRTGYPVELVGGHPALDLLNTIHDWTASEPRDRLEDFGDAIRFAESAGVLGPAEARRLARESHRAARAAALELARLRRLRTLLERLFRASVRSRSPARADLSALDAVGLEVARAARWSTATRKGMPLERLVTPDSCGLAALRLRLADAAAVLLASTLLARVKDCPACGWFFLDASKNRSRRWCSMDTCGASAKSKAYYRRVTAGGARLVQAGRVARAARRP